MVILAIDDDLWSASGAYRNLLDMIIKWKS